MAGGEAGAYRQGFAGDTLNTSYYARAMLDEDWSVDYLTAIGTDIYSDQLLSALANYNIGTNHIQRFEDRHLGLYLIHQADGDRHFTYWRENSAARLLADDETALKNAIDNTDLIYFSGITLAILSDEARARLLTTISRAREAGATVAFDPNIRPVLWKNVGAIQSALTAAAKVSSIVLPTHDDEKPIFGDRTPSDTAARYLACGCDEIVVKNGAEAALIVTKDGSVSVSPPKDANVVDATGAGDSFNGAYLAARLTGTDIANAAAAGHRTAVTVIGQKGALVDVALIS